MTETDYLDRRPTGRSGISLRAVMGTSLLAFIGGAALIGWLVYDGTIKVGPDFARRAAPAPVVQTAPVLPAPAPGVAAGGMDQRIAALEQRLARIDLQAAASEGNTARAEALLVALAARRAIERGAPLGYLETQLKLRFGDAQANSVGLLIEHAKRPVTLDQLNSDLEALAPALVGMPRGENGWQRMSREISSLFVIRRGDAPSAQPDTRLERARLMLRSGQVDAALAEVERLPGSGQAGDWLNSARRYAAAQRALDQLETAALLEPELLRNAAGTAVRQPGPGAPVQAPVI